jgi:uncharacterized protein YxjI
MKQRVFSWGDQFTVKNEFGADAYSVRGEVFTLGKKLHVYDASGAEAAFIKQRLFTFLPKFEIYIGGAMVAEVVKEFTFFRPSYRLDGTGWSISGDFFAHEYVISDGNAVAARISKHWFTWGDSYEIDVAPGRNDLAVIAAALAVDAAVAVQSQ